jgi:PAS domain S-box-containing protein
MILEVSKLVENLKHMQKIDSGDHLVLLYRDDNIEDMVASYIAASINRNERCMYIKGDTNTEEMLISLSNLVDSDKAIDNGQLFVLNRSEAYSMNGIFVPDRMIELLQNEAENAVKDGYTGLAVTGELSWLLDYEDGKEKIIEYEWKLNDRVFDYYPITAMCRYRISKFNPSMIKSIIELHPFIIYDGQINENPYYIAPEGYRDNKVEEYEVAAWLKNIHKFTNTKSKFINDIEKKEIEYQDLFHRIQDGIFISEVDHLNKDLKILDANKAAENLSGYTLIEIKNSSVSKLDGKEGLYEWAKSVPNGYETTFESEISQKDGTTKDVEVNAKLYEENGKQYVLTVAKDISFKKRYVEDILATVTNFLEIHDDYTKGHSENVAILAKETAKAMCLSSKLVDETYLTGLVHDIGKMLISGNILNKPGSLSDEEYEKIKMHPSWAYDAIIKNKELSEIAKDARHHHERWDGKGYPDGLAGDEIPIVSQILIVADAYDAMTSERSYRKAMTKEAAISEIRACRGTQFPPHVSDIFIKKVLK